MSVSWPDSLRHVLDEIAFISEQLTHTDEDRFMHDPTLQRAFVRSLEIIGEAIKKRGSWLRHVYSLATNDLRLEMCSVRPLDQDSGGVSGL